MDRILDAIAREREAEESEPLIGRQLDDRYRIVGRLGGGGGMGEVYEVEHVRLQRRFALKLLRGAVRGERELVERFHREARAVATLHSDYVVSVVDSGALADGRPFFVMERLLGPASLPVGELLAPAALSTATASDAPAPAPAPALSAARATKAARAITSAPATPPSARPSVSWFDPRNPYGK